MSKSTSSSQEFGDMESVSTNNTGSNAGSNELGNFVLKLKIKSSDGTPQIRRVRLSRLLNESGGVSYQELVGLTLTFTYPQGSKEDFHVSLTYFDSDDDTITIASDEELLDAIEQFRDAKVLRITTEVKPKATGASRVSDRGTSTADAAGFRQMPHRNVFGSVVGALSSAVSQVQDTFTTEDGTVPPPPPSAPREPQPAPENTNTRGTASAPAPTAEDMEEDEDGPKFFIHGRHTCDSCLVTPIVGKRYHADNIPDYDLCEKCYSNYTGKEIKFSAVELDRDRAFQIRWRRRQEKIKLFNKRRGGPRCNRRPCGGPGHKVPVPPEVAAQGVKEAPKDTTRDMKDAPGCGPPPPPGPPPPGPPHGPPPPGCHPPPPPHGPPHGPPPPGCHPPPPPHGPPHGPPPPPPPPHCPPFGPDGFGPPPPFGPPHGPPPPCGPDGFGPPPPFGPPHGPPPHFWHGMHGAHHFMQHGMHHSHGPFPEPMFMGGMGPPDGFPPQAPGFPHAGRRRPSPSHNDDDDLKEAIRRSLRDIAPAEAKIVQENKTPTQEAKAPVVVEPKAVEEVEIVVESKETKTNSDAVAEDTMEVDTSAMEEAMETTSVDSEKLLAEEEEIVVPPVEAVVGTPRSISRDESYESEAAGSGEIAEAMGATLDKVAGMISEMLVEADSPTKKAPEATEKVDEATTAAQGTLILDNANSVDKKDKEENEWEVVNDVEDKDSQGDDGIARAASMLGSALFNSDMKESVRNESVGNMSNLSDSFSVPSTVPTVTQPPSSSRWQVQLDQLAELGFTDEAKNVEIFERLEAANIGSGEDQSSISISRVVEALLEN